MTGGYVHNGLKIKTAEGYIYHLLAENEQLKRTIRAEHAYKASIGGGPCVCDVCATLAEQEDTDG